MESYNRLIADKMRNNVERYLETNAQPHALSTPPPVLYGGKRVREHPQVGRTAYSNEPSTLAPEDNLMLRRFPADDIEGGSFFDSFKKGISSVGHAVAPVLAPVAKDVFKEAVVPVLKDTAKEGIKSLVASKGSGRRPIGMPAPAVMPATGGKRRGRPSKGGNVGEDILHGIETVGKAVAPFAPLLMGLGVEEKKAKKTGGKRGRPSKKAGNIGQDILHGIETVGKTVAPFAPLLMGLGVEEKKAKKAVKTTGGKRGRPKKSEMDGGSIWGDIGNAFKSVGHAIAPVAVPIATELGKDAIKGYMAGEGRKRGRPSKKGGASELYPPSVAKGGKRKASVKAGAKSERGALIKKVMKEHGLNLGQASKFIKEHNLF